MALAGPYPDPDVTLVRFGSMYDFDPNAHAPLPFVYIVGDAEAPEETWGQEAVLFHNPRAKIPLLKGLFETVSEGQLEDGKYSEIIKEDFIPFMSMSQLNDGSGHRQAAIESGDRVYNIIKETYADHGEKKPA
jgi:hypothetical protein